VAGLALPENAYRARAERGEIQIGTWITMIRTPSVLTLLQAAGLDYARLDLEHSAFSIETVADIAAAVGLSVRALDDGFHRYVGTPPMTYLRQVRMVRAHEELLAADPELTTASVVSRNCVPGTARPR